MSYLTDQDHRVVPGQVKEDQVTSYIEKHTSQLPSSFYLGVAGVSVAASLILKLAGRDRDAQFVGQWVAPFLLFGIYNKLVKQHGSDAQVHDRSGEQTLRAA
jgi:zinc transporter ZupT